MCKFKLPRLKQCEKCPWKKTTNPYDIPDGYDVEKHKTLTSTIRTGDDLFQQTSNMACHHSDGEDSMYCVGWLHNQLGVGNNIMLRLQMMNCENIGKIKLVGAQHERFEDTLPKEIKNK
jgi:hypothetical protein